MSSPSRPRQDLDPVLRYAPPRVREQAQTPRAESSAAPPVDRPGWRDAKSTPEFSGDRAYADMQRRLAREPEWVPQPPPSLHGRDFWKTILRAGCMLGVIAIVAWLVVSTPLMKLLLGSPFPSARFPSTSIADDAAAPLPLQAAMIEHARSMQQRPASVEPTVNSSDQKATEPPPAPTPVVAEVPPEVLQQLQTIESDLAVIRHTIEEIASKQEQTSRDVASIEAAEQNLSKQISSLARVTAVRPAAQKSSHTQTPKQSTAAIPAPQPERPPLPVPAARAAPAN